MYYFGLLQPGPSTEKRRRGGGPRCSLGYPRHQLPWREEGLVHSGQPPPKPALRMGTKQIHLYKVFKALPAPNCYTRSTKSVPTVCFKLKWLDNVELRSYKCELCVCMCLVGGREGGGRVVASSRGKRKGERGVYREEERWRLEQERFTNESM